MKRKLNFVWIDDNPERDKSAKNLQKALGCKITFIDVRDKELNEQLAELFKNSKPDLVIIDHVLNRLDNSQDNLITTGSTLAELIREKWPKCPIIGVTGAKPVEDVDLHKKWIYEDLYPYQDLSEHYHSIASIAKSFRTLASKKLRSVNGLIASLNPPKDDILRLRAIIPRNLKTNYSDISLPIRISRWVRYTLIGTPGFLYDTLWSATLLGLKESSLSKADKFLFKGKYNGIFADESDPRWWQTKIRELLYQKFSPKELGNTRTLGRMLPKIREKDYSSCYACKGDEPEIVGYTDENANTRVQLHLRCSVPHPYFERLLHFEEIRMMKGAE